MIFYMNPIILHAASHSGGFDILDIIADTLLDALKMLPLLFIAYLIIEIIEHRAMDKLKRAFSSEKAGVLSGAVLGLFPQCGFSVAAANLYSEKLISAGAIVAVFISTSDEALPIILSKPETAKYFVPLVGIKFVSAVLAGFLLNICISLFKKKHTESIQKSENAGDSEHQHEIGHEDNHVHSHEHEHNHEHFNVIHSEHVHEGGEHHHCAVCDSKAGIIKNSVMRTLSTLIFIVITVFVFNSAVSLLGEESIEHLMESVSVFQPFIAALVGLIPSCAASVILAGLFGEGVISFGALAAGLCAGAGAGLAVLFKANGSVKNSLGIMTYVWLFSSAVGVIISVIA